ncbi:MAG TPA: hypothetical protein VFN61_08345 [Acidimicrobiales bacterium]|nr:hypothetical protein [Acidimicrobiales bacterium]
MAAVAVVPALILPPLFTSLPTASASVPRAASSPVLANPPSNIPRTQAMEQACTGDDEAGCDAAVVKGIDDARAAERVRPLQLPAGFASLSTPAQLLVLANLERTDRGLPGFSGLSSRLDSLAAQGAAANADPQGPDGTDWGSNWAGGEQTALLADYDWMYDDGPGSPNLDCPKAGSSGCWDHRENILWDYGPHPSMGAAATRVDGVTSMTELFSSGAPGALDTALPSNAGGTGAGAAQPAPTTESPSARNQVASSPQVPVPPKPAAAGPELHPAHVFHPLAMPADVMPLRLQVSGVPAVPVTRLITLSAPVSGFRLTRTFDN